MWKAVPARSAAALVALLLAACGGGDARRAVLEERVRWKVEPLSMAATPDGGMVVSARITGPVRSDLERLTVRLLLEDAQGRTVGHEWRTLDVSAISRGRPTEVNLIVAPRDQPIAAVGIDLVPSPTPAEAERMPELAGD